MAAELNIHQKLAKIREQVEVMKKDTKAYGYNYVKEEDILAKITVFMKKYDLSLVPGIVPGTTKVVPYSVKKTKTLGKEIYEENVNEVLVYCDMTWTWLCNSNPEERIVVPWSMVGQQSDASQSFGSGLTYSSRYFLLKYFNVSTSNDDPDNWRSKQKAAEVAEDLAIARELISEVDEIIKSYLAINPTEADKVKELVSKYVKDGNYFGITESVLAGKLLSELKETLSKEEK